MVVAGNLVSFEVATKPATHLDPQRVVDDLFAARRWIWC